LSRDTLKILLSLSAIGAGIYLAIKWAESGSTEPFTSDYLPPYNPYSTDDPATAYAGTLEPMTKQRYSPRALKTSSSQMAKIEQFEGRRYTPYQDSAGKLTIGVGHLIKSGDGLSAQSILNDAQVNSLYAGDLIDAENSIYSRVTAPLSQGEFDALVDFIFQFGDAKFGSSNLLRLLNLRNYENIPAEFSKWINVNGAASPQLVARRSDDASTFLT
jgi:lysozyme